MRRVRWLLLVLSSLLGGCGVPFEFAKPASSTGLIADQVTVTPSAAGSFSALLVRPAPVLTTGEQAAGPPSSATEPARGVGALSQLDEAITFSLTAGAGVRMVASGPDRSDLSLTLSVDGQASRIDDDPLGVRREVESFVISADKSLSFTVRAEDLNESGRLGYVRWYAFLLPSSLGEVRCRHESAGPAGSLVVPDRFSFDALRRGDRWEVLMIGPSGSDLVAEVTVGSRRFEVDEDPQEPQRTVEAFVLRVDDPARVQVDVQDYAGGSVPGSVYWAVLRLPNTSLRDGETTEE